MSERDDALRQIADLLAARLYRFVDGARSGHPLESMTGAMADLIERRLGILVETLIRPGPIDEEGKKALAANVYSLLVAVNTASHGVGNIIDFREKSKAKTLKNKRAAVMRRAKEPRVAANHPKLDQAVKDEAESRNRAIAISEKFAGDILDALCARLKLKPDARGMTTISAIVRSAQRIRATRAKKRG